MGGAAPSNPSPKSYYSMDCEYRAHAAIFLARQEAACDPFSALNLSVDKFHLREHVQHQVAAVQRFRAKSMYSNSHLRSNERDAPAPKLLKFKFFIFE